MLQPAPTVRMAITGGDVVLLDLTANRYLGVPDAIIRRSDQVEAATLADIVPEAATALVEAGMLIEGDTPAPLLCQPLPMAAKGAFPSAKPGVRDVMAIAGILARVGWRVWQDRPFRRQEQYRTTPSSDDDDPELHRQLAKLHRLRLLVPTPRRCLPAALVTSLWLRRAGIETEVVFGVRTHPFEAHCWVERGQVALDDDMDRLRGYTPIAIAIP